MKSALRTYAPYAVLAVAVALYDLRFHEFWRDEVAAMGEARYVTARDALYVLRVEGVPPLFHLLLMLAARALPDPYALVAVGALGFAVLLVGVHEVVEAITSSDRSARVAAVAFGCTYAFGYELGVMVRQYALGLGLALCALAWFRRALTADGADNAGRGTIAAALAILTSVHAACVAGGALLAFGVVAVARRRPLREVGVILATLPSFVAVMAIAAPFHARYNDSFTTRHHSAPATLALLGQAVVAGFMPFDWWYAEGFAEGASASLFSGLRSAAFAGVALGVPLAVAARALARRDRAPMLAYDLLAVGASLPPLLGLTVEHYWGFYRHHLFGAVPMLVVLVGWGSQRAVGSRLAEELRRVALALLAPWFGFQAALLLTALALDARYPFSDTKAAAAQLPRGAHVVIEMETQSGGIAFWRPDVVVIAANRRGRVLRYPLPDREQLRGVSLPGLLRSTCADAPDGVFFAGQAAKLGALGTCAQAVEFPKTPFETQPFTWETFDLLAVDCACVTAAR